MYIPDFRNQFHKDYRRCLKRGLPEGAIKQVMGKIVAGEPLPTRCRLHKLSGEWADCWECHVKPDWLLLWIVDEEVKRVEFVRTGTHSDLFG